MMSRSMGSVLIVCAASACAQTDLPPEVILLARIRHQAQVDLTHLPNFTCLETIHRSTGTPPKGLRKLDTVQMEVANADGRELFAWPGEKRFEQRSLFEMLGAGLVSTGEYIVDARNVLAGGAARIRYGATEDVHGRPVARFDYEVSPAFSGYQLTVGDRTAIIGSKGSFWADPSSYQLLRLAFAGTEIPYELGVRGTSTQIDYTRVRIAESSILLPQTAVTSLTRANGEKVENEIEFSACRQFGAESVMSVEQPSNAAPAAPAPAAKEVMLPAGYNVSLRLDTPIKLSSANVGNSIKAILDTDVKVGDQIYAPKGAVVSGRLRLLQKADETYTVGIEWTDLDFGNNHAKFMAILVAVDRRFAGLKLQKNIQGKYLMTETPPDMAGVGTFLVPKGVRELPRGLRMQWKIVGFGN